MIQKNTNVTKKDRGFTIVELLLVIFVIGILAVITLVITQRANTSSAQAAANAAISKATAYTVDGTTGTWPTSFAQLTGAASTASYYLSGVTYIASPSGVSPNVVNYYTCVVGTSTGIAVGYWNYTPTAAINYYYSGSIVPGTGGTSTALPTGTGASVCTLAP